MIDETKACQLEVCLIAAMVGCNITNQLYGSTGCLLQYDMEQRKLVGAYVLHLMFCYASGQNMKKEFELSPFARQLFDDDKTNFIFKNIQMTESEKLIEIQFLKVFQVSILSIKN